MPEQSSPTTASRTPAYFVSIGGPNFMEDFDHPAYERLATIGREITQKIKPKAVVVISAHWQSDSRSKIEVNVAEKAGIIYDFWGFPRHYYKYEYPYKGSPEVAERVIEKLEGAGIGVERVKRGLDHGVWVGFLAAFNPRVNPLNVPIVQISMFADEDPGRHYRLGEALQTLREENIVIIGAGMAAHNLRDFRSARSRGINNIMPYTTTFDDALAAAASSEPEEREEKMMDLFERVDTQRAHPTLEHILPIYIAAGAAGSDVGERLWTFAEASLNWAQYRFGEVGPV